MMKKTLKKSLAVTLVASFAMMMMAVPANALFLEKTSRTSATNWMTDSGYTATINWRVYNAGPGTMAFNTVGTKGGYIPWGSSYSVPSGANRAGTYGVNMDIYKFQLAGSNCTGSLSVTH